MPLIHSAIALDTMAGFRSSRAWLALHYAHLLPFLPIRQAYQSFKVDQRGFAAALLPAFRSELVCFAVETWFSSQKVGSKFGRGYVLGNAGPRLDLPPLSLLSNILQYRPHIAQPQNSK
jgi:hypothetical protein